MLKFDCGCRIMSECINLNSADYKKPNWGYFFIFLLCKCLWKVWQETNEIQGMEMFMNYEDENIYFHLRVEGISQNPPT
jgi:hypothetical protein